MPLDPEIADILRDIALLPAMESLSVQDMRAGMVPPELALRAVVGQVEDIVITGGPAPIAGRLYRPLRQLCEGLAIFFHGGGFVIGNLETHDHVCRDLCERSGCAVLAVDYRLAPEHKFPAAPDDCLQAVRWASEHGAALGIDTGKLVLVGDSAGGNLAAVTALRVRDEGGPDLCGQALLYPVTDYHTPPTRSYLDNAVGYSLTRAAMIRFWDAYLDSAHDAAHPHTSPLRAPVLRGLPPTLVVTAEFDPLRDEGEHFAHRLLDAGVPVTLMRYDGVIHGFLRMGLRSARAREAMEMTACWIRQRLAQG